MDSVKRFLECSYWKTAVAAGMLAGATHSAFRRYTSMQVNGWHVFGFCTAATGIFYVTRCKRVRSMNGKIDFLNSKTSDIEADEKINSTTTTTNGACKSPKTINSSEELCNHGYRQTQNSKDSNSSLILHSNNLKATSEKNKIDECSNKPGEFTIQSQHPEDLSKYSQQIKLIDTSFISLDINELGTQAVDSKEKFNNSVQNKNDTKLSSQESSIVKDVFDSPKVNSSPKAKTYKTTGIISNAGGLMVDEESYVLRGSNKTHRHKSDSWTSNDSFVRMSQYIDCVTDGIYSNGHTGNDTEESSEDEHFEDMDDNEVSFLSSFSNLGTEPVVSTLDLTLQAYYEFMELERQDKTKVRNVDNDS